MQLSQAESCDSSVQRRSREAPVFQWTLEKCHQNVPYAMQDQNLAREESQWSLYQYCVLL